IARARRAGAARPARGGSPARDPRHDGVQGRGESGRPAVGRGDRGAAGAARAGRAFQQLSPRPADDAAPLAARPRETVQTDRVLIFLPPPVLRGRVGVGVLSLRHATVNETPPCPPPEYRRRERTSRLYPLLL